MPEDAAEATKLTLEGWDTKQSREGEKLYNWCFYAISVESPFKVILVENISEAKLSKIKHVG